MKLGEKLSKLRKANNYTQEQLADLLGVSRQSISKWEQDIAFPETDRLIQMSELFHCSLDYLLKDNMESDHPIPPETTNAPLKHGIFHERKSTKTLCGMPLWHIGRKARGFIAIGLDARGIIAIGLSARGIISVGMLSLGLLSFGMVSIGLLSAGLFSLGFLSSGCFSAGILSTGAISLGVLSLGAVAVGDFSVGALAIGKYFAMGDNARALIALGDTEAAGSVFEKVGQLTAQEAITVKELLDTTVPSYFAWIKELVKLFI